MIRGMRALTPDRLFRGRRDGIFVNPFRFTSIAVTGLATQIT